MDLVRDTADLSGVEVILQDGASHRFSTAGAALEWAQAVQGEVACICMRAPHSGGRTDYPGLGVAIATEGNDLIVATVASSQDPVGDFQSAVAWCYEPLASI